jgi:hypothetical protein
MAADEAQTHISAIVDRFNEELGSIVNKSIATSLHRLQGQIEEDDRGRVKITHRNQRALSRVDKLFLEEMDKNGFDALLLAFSGEFPATLPDFRKTYAMIGGAMQTELPEVRFSASDQKVLVGQQMNARAAMRAAVKAAAEAARRDAMFSVGGMRYQDLVETLSAKLHKSVGEADTIASTAISTYYRTITALGYEKIEDEIAGTPYYRFSGPKDDLNRPWCAARLKARDKNKTYTRAEIEQMDNGQLPNPFLTAGGYRCRHQWTLDRIAPGKNAPVVPFPGDVPEVPSSVPAAPPPAGGGRLGKRLVAAGLAAAGLTAAARSKALRNLLKGVKLEAKLPPKLLAGPPPVPPVPPTPPRRPRNFKVPRGLTLTRAKILAYRQMLEAVRSGIAQHEDMLRGPDVPEVTASLIVDSLVAARADEARVRAAIRALSADPHTVEDRIQQGLAAFHRQPRGGIQPSTLAPADIRRILLTQASGHRAVWQKAQGRYVEAVKAMARINDLTSEGSLFADQRDQMLRSATAQLREALKAREWAHARYLLAAKPLYYAIRPANIPFLLGSLPGLLPDGIMQGIADVNAFLGEGLMNAIQPVRIELMHFGGRAGYIAATRTLELDPLAATEVMIHEFGHVVEQFQEIRRHEQEFFESRTAGSPFRSFYEIAPATLETGITPFEFGKQAVPPWPHFYLSRYYTQEPLPKPSELGYADQTEAMAAGPKVIADQIAKWFNDHPPHPQAFELTSMGFENLQTDPVGFARADPEHFDFIMRVLEFLRTGSWPA